MFVEHALEKTMSHWLAIGLPSKRIFYIYLLSAFVIAAGSYLWFAAREEGERPDGVRKGMLGFIFDPEIWLHKSARQDYIFFLVNAVIYYGIISQLLIGGHIYFGVFAAGLEALFGTRSVPLFEASVFSFAVYTLIVVLAVDLAVYITHYLQHKVMSLWQFHKVHHSAEVLTPMTLYRMHPVDLLLTGLVSGALIGLALAGFVYLSGSAPTQMTIMNVNIVFFVFYLVGYNLRHSHIWVSYPRWLSYIFISPAQHQTHHSIAEKHHDRNFGLVFAFWDWMFGTLYVPRGYEKLEFGVAGPEPNPFRSVKDIYLKPFADAWRLIKPSSRDAKRRAIAVSIITVVTIGYLGVTYSRDAQAHPKGLPSVYLEDLTWTEVAMAQGKGVKTVIIPTGGTEQNGPHVVLGKHNYVVRQSSGLIARELGDTLVAPVLPYVPEGDFAPEKTGHMRWPGTLTVSDKIFESVLESTARSLLSHGFETVVFVGDSFGNQKGQIEVASRLSEELAMTGSSVVALTDYYRSNGQFEYLLANGISPEEIGRHAGVRDTSEMLAVNPNGVRKNPIQPPDGWVRGSDGETSIASASIGETMLSLKVEAAVAQFRAIERERKEAQAETLN